MYVSMTTPSLLLPQPFQHQNLNPHNTYLLPDRALSYAPFSTPLPPPSGMLQTEQNTRFLAANSSSDRATLLGVEKAGFLSVER